MVSPSPSWDAIIPKAKEVLKDRDITTYGQFKRKLADVLDVAVDQLQRHKGSLQDLIAAEADQNNTAASDEDRVQKEEEEEEEEEKEKEKEKEKGEGNEGASRREDSEGEEECSAAMVAMRAMARAMNLGPKPFRGLKDMKSKDAENTLKDRLIDAGAQIKGRFPSAREIAQARRKTETERDLDGIDPGNVVHGSRRRGRANDHDVIPPKKKPRAAASPEGSSDSERSEEASSGDEESEEEFRLSE